MHGPTGAFCSDFPDAHLPGDARHHRDVRRFTLGLLTVCQERGPELPGFNAAFAAGVFVADLATAFLLLIMFRREATRSVLLLAAAFLFSALMALAYLLTSPGAVTSGRPLFGTAQTISWVYNS